jgi:uncharacterized integral membrane protein
MAESTGKQSLLSEFRLPGTKLEGWRAVVVVLVAVYLVLFVVLNTRRVEVNFVFFKLRSHMLLAFALVIVLGFVIGYFFRGRRESGKAVEASADGPPAVPAVHE